jgi:hypothetical protein
MNHEERQPTETRIANLENRIDRLKAILAIHIFVFVITALFLTAFGAFLMMLSVRSTDKDVALNQELAELRKDMRSDNIAEIKDLRDYFDDKHHDSEYEIHELRKDIDFLKEQTRPIPPSTKAKDESESDESINLFNVIPKDCIKRPALTSDVITQARVIPHYIGAGRERRIDGVRIYRIQPDSMFDCLGLKNGDIIKSINDQPLTDVDIFIKHFKQIKDQTEFRIDVERQGAVFFLLFKVE